VGGWEEKQRLKRGGGKKDAVISRPNSVKS
jgi:hypothetical protein